MTRIYAGIFLEEIMRRLLGFLILSLLACTVLWAQATAEISGTIKDTSGAVLPGVEVTVTQTATGPFRKVLSNETGLYALPSLPTGSYRFEAGLPGFPTYVQTRITLNVNSNAAINIVMEVVQGTEQVEGQANPGLLVTRTG